MASRPGSTLPDLTTLKIDERSRRRGGGRKWMQRFAAALGAILLISALIFALRGKTSVVEVATAHGSSESRATLLNANGYVTPRRRATVAAKITARVTQLFAEEGMRVQEGQVLARLDDSDARARRRSAKADRDATSATLADLQVNLANAERELRRTQELQSGGVSSQQSLDLARTAAESYRARIGLAKEQIRAADARIQVAQQDLDNCTVRAPFAGIVVCKVRTVIPTADRQKATVKVRISFDRLDPRILPDMGVKVTFLGEEPKGAQSGGARVLVPHDSVREEAGQKVVFLFRAGRVERRAVRVAGIRGNEQEVLAGVNDGDKVIVSGFEGLRDGQRVEIKK